MSSSKDKSSAEQGIQQSGSQMYQRGQATPEETSQYQQSFDLGNLVSQLLKYQQGLGQAPAGYQTPEQQYQQQGPLAQSYYNQTLSGVQNPYAAYESQLQPALALTQDAINRNYQQRGLIRSGIPIEAMGRAGVELAIKEAQDRMNFRGQELARGGELSQYSTGLQSSRLANLQNLYGQQQSAGLSAMNRQAGVASQAASYQAAPYTAQLGSYYGGVNALQALPGQVLGAVGTAVGAAYNPYKSMANLGSSAVGGRATGISSYNPTWGYSYPY